MAATGTLIPVRRRGVPEKSITHEVPEPGPTQTERVWQATAGTLYNAASPGTAGAQYSALAAPETVQLPYNVPAAAEPVAKARYRGASAAAVLRADKLSEIASPGSNILTFFSDIQGKTGQGSNYYDILLQEYSVVVVIVLKPGPVSWSGFYFCNSHCGTFCI